MPRAYEPPTAAELRTVTGPRPGTRILHDVLVWHYHGRGVRSAGIYNRRNRRGVLGPVTARGASLHSVGRALDLATTDKALHDEIFLRCIAAADQCGIVEVISWERRWTPDKGVRPYKPGPGGSPHRDHVHVGQSVDTASRGANPEDAKALARWFSHFLFER